MENIRKIKLFLESVDKEISPVIKEVLDLYVDKNNRELVNYQIFTDGKRIRPGLMILTCQMMGGKEKDVIYPAVGIEILHNCSLIIDDIIDNGKIRRGEKTTWVKYGKSIAECISLTYTASIFQAANSSKYPKEISDVFAKTIKTAVDGEISDLFFDQIEVDELYVKQKRYRYKDIDKKDYLKMIEQKTASVIQACCEIGGICANANKNQIKIIKQLGYNIGMAGQIKDDILDIFGKQNIIKKKRYKDIIEGNIGNAVILFALEELSKKDEQRFLNIISKKEKNNKDIKEIMSMINKTKAEEKSLKLGEYFTGKAKQNLEALPQNNYNKFFQIMCDYIIERDK